MGPDIKAGDLVFSYGDDPVVNDISLGSTLGSWSRSGALSPHSAAPHEQGESSQPRRRDTQARKSSRPQVLTTRSAVTHALWAYWTP